MIKRTFSIETPSQKYAEIELGRKTADVINQEICPQKGDFIEYCEEAGGISRYDTTGRRLIVQISYIEILEKDKLLICFDLIPGKQEYEDYDPDRYKGYTQHPVDLPF